MGPENSTKLAAEIELARLDLQSARLSYRICTSKFRFSMLSGLFMLLTVSVSFLLIRTFIWYELPYSLLLIPSFLFLIDLCRLLIEVWKTRRQVESLSSEYDMLLG